MSYAPGAPAQAAAALDEMGLTDVSTRDLADHLGWTMPKAASVMRSMDIHVLAYAERRYFCWYGCTCIWGWAP